MTTEFDTDFIPANKTQKTTFCGPSLSVSRQKEKTNSVVSYTVKNSSTMLFNEIAKFWLFLEAR